MAESALAVCGASFSPNFPASNNWSSYGAHPNGIFRIALLSRV